MPAKSSFESSQTTRNRLVAVLIGVAVLFALIAGRLGFIQVVQARELQEKALGQWTRNLVVTATRGEILDRNGQVLAQSASAYTIIVVPREVKDSEGISAILAEILEMDQSAILDKVRDTSKQQHIIKRQVRREIAEKIRAEKMNGVHLSEDSIRAYPMGAFASQVIGFTDISGQGQTGLELKYDKYLMGVNGKVVAETDNAGREMPYNADEYIPPEHGKNVTLTIDYIIQSIAENVSREAMEINNAKRVQCIMMDVNTGEILADVNIPQFDLNNPPRNDMDELNRLTRNGTVSDAYEPGSTFKIITLAAALEAGVTNMNAGFTCTGSIIVDGDKIRCWRTGNPHGHQTLTEAVSNSCNPVFVDLARYLGRDRFYNYLHDFGLGVKTGVDMAGESAGQVISIKYVKDVDLARIGFGQSISVTPLQLITAASAAVNGGNLMKPYIVKEITTGEGEVLETFEPQLVGNPISEETSAQIRQILETVVTDGGGRNAYIPGYRVGGKTGTAQKYDSSGRIMNDTHVSSFIGFAPMDDPKIACLFIVDEPNIYPDFGSTVAAPFAQKIMSNALQHLGVQPIYEDGEEALIGETIAVPDMIGRKSSEAVAELTGLGLRTIFDGVDGYPITEQMPAAGAIVPVESIVVLYTDMAPEDAPADETKVFVPDVTNMSVIEAGRVIRHAGLQMRLSGSGLAVEQSPPAGTEVQGGSSVSVTFKQP